MIFTRRRSNRELLDVAFGQFLGSHPLADVLRLQPSQVFDDRKLAAFRRFRGFNYARPNFPNRSEEQRAHRNDGNSQMLSESGHLSISFSLNSTTPISIALVLQRTTAH